MLRQALQNFLILARLIVEDQDGDELRLDRFDEERMGHHSSTELPAAGSSRHFLEKGEDRFSGGLRLGERRVEIPPPGDIADLRAFRFGDGEHH